jgi:biopolymer transport protein ExbB/TolQ
MSGGHLSYIELFLAADVVVKSVMIGLGVASILCWALIADVIIGGWRILRSVTNRERGVLPGADALEPVFLTAREAANEALRQGGGEHRKLAVETALRHGLGRLFDRADRSLGMLAIIASAAPFIGLFGTVWGIMHAFAAIAATQETSLAVVAPGIAEALLATALGLAAAIPAAVGHAKLAVWLGRLNRRATRLCELEVLRLSSATPTLTVIRGSAP